MFTDTQLAKTSEAMSNTVVTWSFMAFLNAKFRGRSQSFGAARTDSDSTVATRTQRATSIKNSGLSGQVVDERLAAWSAVDSPVTKNFL